MRQPDAPGARGAGAGWCGAVVAWVATVRAVTQTTGTPGTSARKLWTAVKWIRRAALAGLVVWGAWELLVDGLPRVCGEELYEDDPVRVCEDMGLTDPRVAMFLLTAGLLLLPDLSELEVAGVVRLHRKVDEARQEVAELTGELYSIRNQVSTWAASRAAALSQATGNVTNNYLGPPAAATGAAKQDLESGDTTVLEPDEEDGAFGLLAFNAGMQGLLQSLPNHGAGAVLVGMTFDEGEDLTVQTEVGDDDFDPALAGLLLRQARDLPRNVHTVGDGNLWLITAPARTNSGQVGAVGVAVPEEPTDDTDWLADWADWDTETSDVRAARVTAATELIAGAYARMLVALLGELPIPGQGAGASGGQV